MFNDQDDGSQDCDSAAALIDSYFLPGGILDPEEQEPTTAAGPVTVPPSDPSDVGVREKNAVAAPPSFRSRLEEMTTSSSTLRQPSVVQHGAAAHLAPGSGGGIHEVRAETTGVSALHSSENHMIGGRPILFDGTIASPAPRQGPQPSEHSFGLLSHAPISSPPLSGFQGIHNPSSLGTNMNGFEESMRIPQDNLTSWLSSNQSTSLFQSAPAPAAVDEYSSLFALNSSSSVKNNPTHRLNDPPPTEGRNLLKAPSPNPWGKENAIASPKLTMPSIGNQYANAVRNMNTVSNLQDAQQPRHGAFPGVPSSTATTDTTRSTATISHRPTKNSSFRPPPGFDPHRAREEANRHRSGISQTHYKHSTAAPTLDLNRRSNRNESPYHHHPSSNPNGPVSTPETSQARPRQPHHVPQHPHPPQSNSHHPQHSTQPMNHAQEGDYDALSVTSKSSRGVPSTIYVNQDDDAVSNSEDTLTVCADSVTDVSIVGHGGQPNMNPKTNSGVKSENERMDVVEETSATERKTKTKRQRKKKKKRNVPVVKNEDHSSQAKSYPSVEKILDKSHEPEINQKMNEITSKEDRPVEVKDKEILTITSQRPTSPIHQRKPGKKTHILTNTKSIARQDQRNERNHVRDDLTKKITSPKPVKPRVPLSITMRKLMRQLRPRLLGTWFLLINGTKGIFKSSFHIIILLLPRKERFWFILPLFCVMIDFSFLALSLVFKTIGRIIYYTLVLHKLALLELKESDTAGFCYTVTCTYPQFSQSAMATFSFLPNGTEFVVWYVIVRWLCRPIKMVDTFAYRQKMQERRTRTLQMMKRVRNGQGGNVTMQDVTNFVSDESKEDNKYISGRVKMANHFLNVIRKLTPLQILLEGAVRGESLIMTLSGSERILLGYCFVVLRSGYLFSPIVWISWTIQMTTILFFPLNAFWGHYLFLVGLASIRMSHYGASVDDLRARPNSAKQLFNE